MVQQVSMTPSRFGQHATLFNSKPSARQRGCLGFAQSASNGIVGDADGELVGRAVFFVGKDVGSFVGRLLG